MTTWTQAYITRADRMDRMSIYDRAYTETWNKLEDDILSLPRTMQHELVDLAISVTPMTGAAMVITSMLQFEELTCDNV